MKFKIGDVVRCMSLPSESGASQFLSVGGEYVVTELADQPSSRNHPENYVSFSNINKPDFIWSAECFELILTSKEREEAEMKLIVDKNNEELKVLRENRRLLEI